MATEGTNVVAFFGSEGLYCYDMDGHLRSAISEDTIYFRTRGHVVAVGERK